ncbi:helix-turn-helix domain-containing protein [Streptomyces collinus]|uniref:helix-turn-helix domain-containing protein n=1 Tax=Streptomyces collinus TaxID=42684 RepID=UPI002942262A|nr:helix-turn-helix domain-containing protein [Streptomyces collinus]
MRGSHKIAGLGLVLDSSLSGYMSWWRGGSVARGRVLDGGFTARPSRDENEQRLVHRLSRARKAPRDLTLRARMVELSWSGRRVPIIADELRCSPKTVRRWLHRFNLCGLDGLDDLGGQGRKRRITEAERSRIIGLVRQPPLGRLTVQADGELAAEDEAGPPEWTLDALAAEAGRLGIAIGRSQVRRIQLAEGVRWRRTRSWTRSRDADFEGKGQGSSSSTPARPKVRRSSAPTSSDR